MNYVLISKYRLPEGNKDSKITGRKTIGKGTRQIQRRRRKLVLLYIPTYHKRLELGRMEVGKGGKKCLDDKPQIESHTLSSWKINGSFWNKEISRSMLCFRKITLMTVWMETVAKTKSHISFLFLQGLEPKLTVA